MAIRSIIASAACALCLTATEAEATVYHATICENPADCFIAPPQGAPPGFPDITPLLTVFYDAAGIPHNPITYGVTGSNTQGLVYGPVSDIGNSFETQWIYQNGAILCCTVDFPYRLTAANNDGLFVGRDSGGFPFIGSEITEFWVVPHTPELDAASEAMFPTGFNGPFTELTAIDNTGRIAGTSLVGAILLEPITVPEPGSAMLVLGALSGMLMLRRREDHRD